ncbi:MAG: hypothetical protein ACKVQB_11285 [Bacteroidia bacterium]
MKINKHTFSILLLLLGCSAYGQNNPGFLGKKIALGYNAQFSFINSVVGKEDDMSILQFLTNHDAYMEYSTSKFNSLEFHLSYQKVPVGSYLIMSNIGQINDEFIMNGKKIHAWGEKTGYSYFRYLSYGLKYNFYSRNKSISAPVGFCYYLRFDMHTIKPIRNTYDYDLYAGTEQENNFVNKNINRNIDNSSSFNFSLGAGADTKLMLNRSTFIRFNGEFNLSTVGITQSVGDNFFTQENTVERDLKLTGQSTNRFRNMFLFGLGVGYLL